MEESHDHKLFRRTMSASLIEGVSDRLDKRVGLAQNMLVKLKECGQCIGEEEIDSILRILGSEAFTSDFASHSVESDQEDLHSHEEDTLRWLQHTYTKDHRRGSIISNHSFLSSQEDSGLTSPLPSSYLDSHHFHDGSYEPGEFPFEIQNEAELRSALANLDLWDFDVFAFDSVTNHRPLLFITWEVLRRHGCLEQYNIDLKKLRSLLMALESGYKPNPYHNNIHAADVVQTMHFFLLNGLAAVISPLEVLAVIIASAAHDVGHDGKNNIYHINTASPLAIRYNDNSVLENFHASTLFSLACCCDELQPFSSLGPADFSIFRKTVIRLILATDMSHHLESFSNLKLRIEIKGVDPTAWDSQELLLQALLHAADISNPVKRRPISTQWTDRCLQEFWAQGDSEKELGLPVSPMCDRATTSRAQSQIGFINFVVKPFFVTLAQVLPALKICVDIADENLAFWEEERAAASLQ